jgi:hypothetical protein
MAALKTVGENGEKRISFTYQDVVKWGTGIVAVVSVIVAIATAVFTAGAQASKLEAKINGKADQVTADSLGRRMDAQFMATFALREVPADIADIKQQLADFKGVACQYIPKDSMCQRRAR